MLDADAVIALSTACAPGVAPATLLAVARAESALDPLAIGVNGAPGARPRPATRAQAVAASRALIAAGRNLDLGLAQINVRNLARLGLSLDDAFDPCRNLAAAAQVLREGYARGRDLYGPGQPALRVALSHYNTGHLRRGFSNGYVARVVAHAGAVTTPPSTDPARAAQSTAPPAAWDVFGRAAAVRTRFVLTVTGGAP